MTKETDKKSDDTAETKKPKLTLSLKGKLSLNIDKSKLQEKALLSMQEKKNTKTEENNISLINKNSQERPFFHESLNKSDIDFSKTNNESKKTNDKKESFDKEKNLKKDTNSSFAKKNFKEYENKHFDSKNKKAIDEEEELSKAKDKKNLKKDKEKKDEEILPSENIKNIKLSDQEEKEYDEDYIKMYGGGINIVENFNNYYVPAAKNYSRKSKYRKPNNVKIQLNVPIYDGMPLSELAKKSKTSVSDMLRKTKKMGFEYQENSSINIDDAEMILNEIGHNVKRLESDKLFNILEKNIISQSSNTKIRNPIVTILGHVDHGKTTLIEKIKGSSLTEKESGGITQKVSCYQVGTPSGKKITFIDTPGHELFSSSRERGVSINDIIVIVIAADDGIMPQTTESINYALKSKSEIIIAINKIDKAPNNVNKIHQDLLQYGIISEEMGGQVSVVPISAIENKNIDKLIHAIEEQAEVMELKTNYEGHAIGYVVDSFLNANSGYSSNIVMKHGHLKIGDIILTESTYGKVKKIQNYSIDGDTNECYPSDVAEISSFNEIPKSGAKFIVCENESIAKKSIKESSSRDSIVGKNTININDVRSSFFNNTKEEAIFLNINIRADTNSSLEVLESLINKINKYKKVKIKVLSKSTNQVLESDINNSKNTKSTIVVFGPGLSNKIKQFAEKNKVQVIENDIIYKIEEELLALMKSRTKIVDIENLIAKINIKKIFVLSNKDIIVGGLVVKGGFTKKDIVKIIKNEDEKNPLHVSYIDEIRIEKERKNEIKQNQECGVKFTTKCNFDIDPNIHKLYVYKKESLQEELV